MDCLFCKIIKGEIPTQKVYETDQVIVIRDINPHAPVHDLVIPKKHISGLNELTDREIAADLLMAVREVAKIEKIADSGYRVIINSGKNSGLLIPHLHLHVLGGKDLGPKLVAG